MFSARLRMMIRSNLNTAHVIFEDTTLNIWNRMIEREFEFLEFVHLIEDIYEFTKGRGKSNVFCFSSTEINKRLHLGSPNNGTASVSKNITSAGMCIQWIMWRLILP